MLTVGWCLATVQGDAAYNSRQLPMPKSAPQCCLLNLGALILDALIGLHSRKPYPGNITHTGCFVQLLYWISSWLLGGTAVLILVQPTAF